MAKGFNKVVILGNLTRDPELRTTPNGQSVASFSLAINRQWRNSEGETQEAVDFVDCTAWGKVAEIIEQYMEKGRPLLVSGRLQSSSWEQDGKKRSKLEVVVEDFNFISDGRGGSSKPSSSKDDTTIEDIDEEPVDLSDIPF